MVRFLHSSKFETPAESLDEILALIKETKTGKNIVSTLDSLLNSGKISIRPFEKELKEKLIESLEEGPLQQTFSLKTACFVTDGQTGEIYFDFEAPIGLSVCLLFHEIIHSLDPTLWMAAQTKLRSFERREVLFRSECKAYREQHRFQEELKALYPELKRFLKDKYPHLNYLHRALEPDEIANQYQKFLKTA